MKRDDWMLLSLTFLTGVAIGMYIYVAAFKPIYAPENLDSEEATASEWSIVSKRRGGDYDPGHIQPSFRLLKNGKYVHIPGGRDGESLEPVEGSMPRTVMNDLVFSEADLAAYSRQVSGTSCASDQGGFDYEYRITLNGETSVLDTCDTALGENTGLSRSLYQIWQRLEGTNDRSYDTPAAWLEAWLRRNLGTEEGNY